MLKFKELTKYLLFERRDINIEKCCVLFNLTEKLAGPISKLGKLIDSNDLHEYGVENEPHITGLYGILPSENALAETQEVLKKYPKQKIRATLGKCGLFENDEFDVLKFDVLSQDLNNINNLLTKNLDYENDYDEYHPHMTIAYLKPGTGQKYADMINSKLRGFPLDFGPPIFSDENQNHYEMILGYPDNECAKHPETGQMNEDLGYGGAMPGGGAPYMSGHMGVYNSPDTKVPRTAAQYARYNMMNNNTVVSSGYYDTVFNADIKKVMLILKELGFKVEKYVDRDEYSARGMKRADQTHTMTDTSNTISSDDVMHDDSGINLGKDAALNLIAREMGIDKIKSFREKQEIEITYDEIMTGLNQEMRRMKYPDKDFATIATMKRLMEDPKYYSSLGQYDINENVKQIKGTNMKSDCKVNTKELGSIVRNMLAEKNQMGRRAFGIMKEEPLEAQSAQDSLLSLLDNAEMTINKYRSAVNRKVSTEELTEIIDELNEQLSHLRQRIVQHT